MSDDKYRDILYMEHPTSRLHPRMSMLSRASQFAPFAALSGYDDVISETGRLTDGRVEYSADALAELDESLREISERLDLHPRINVVYFVPDMKKNGGKYVEYAGEVREIDAVYRRLLFMDKTEIPLDVIVNISLE